MFDKEIALARIASIVHLNKLAELDADLSFVDAVGIKDSLLFNTGPVWGSHRPGDDDVSPFASWVMLALRCVNETDVMVICDYNSDEHILSLTAICSSGESETCFYEVIDGKLDRMVDSICEFDELNLALASNPFDKDISPGISESIINTIKKASHQACFLSEDDLREAIFVDPPAV